MSVIRCVESQTEPCFCWSTIMISSFWSKLTTHRRRARRNGSDSRLRQLVWRPCLEELEDRTLLSLSAVILKDINPGLADSSPREFVTLNKTTFFTADDGVHGTELWRTDGTRGGTSMVKDINLGSGGSNPQNLVDFNGTLFFAADDGTHGSELWSSDGSDAGTSLIKDINPSGGSGPSFLTSLFGTLYFTAFDGVNASDLWKSDGTSTGTVLVSNVSVPEDFTGSGGIVYFRTSRGLYRTDGTAAGTVLLAPVGNVQNMVDFNGRLMFFANDGTNGDEPWTSNGTPAGTFMVKDINPFGNSVYEFARPVVIGSVMYFSVSTPGGLYQTDGTSAGTVQVAVPGFGNHIPTDLANIGVRLFFV